MRAACGRGVYQGQEMSLAMGSRLESGGGSGGGGGGGAEARILGRPRTKMNAASGTWTVLVSQLLCQGPHGRPVPLHECDVAFMSYENLRKELGYADRRALAYSCSLLHTCLPAVLWCLWCLVALLFLSTSA